jgi:hypothetical protein
MDFELLLCALYVLLTIYNHMRLQITNYQINPSVLLLYVGYAAEWHERYLDTIRTDGSPNLCFDVATLAAGTVVKVMCVVKGQKHFFVQGTVTGIQYHRNRMISKRAIITVSGAQLSSATIVSPH